MQDGSASSSSSSSAAAAAPVCVCALERVFLMSVVRAKASLSPMPPRMLLVLLSGVIASDARRRVAAAGHSCRPLQPLSKDDPALARMSLDSRDVRIADTSVHGLRSATACSSEDMSSPDTQSHLYRIFISGCTLARSVDKVWIKLIVLF